MPSPQLQNIGLALQGFGSGLQGQLPQFLQAQNQKQGLQMQQQTQDMQMQQMNQQMMEQRQKALFTDANAALQLAEQGNIDGVVQLGVQRLQMLKQLSQQDPSIDPSDTQRITQLAIAAKNGEQEALDLLKDELRSTVQTGQAMGILETPKPEVISGSDVSDQGQMTVMGADGVPRAIDVEGFKGSAKGYSILDEQQKLELGLDPAKAYQVNDETGQISAIGSGGVVVNMPSPIDKGTEEYGKGIGARANSRIEQAVNAQSQNSSLERMNEAIASGAQTGLGQETILDIKNFANSLFGIPIDEAAGEQEVLRALSNRLVMEVRNPASGLGLTGSTSNRDLDFLSNAVPTLAKTPQGNALLVEYLMKQNKFKQDIATMQQSLIDANNGAVPSNLDTKLMEYMDSYKFMDDDFKAAVQEAVKVADEPESQYIIEEL